MKINVQIILISTLTVVLGCAEKKDTSKAPDYHIDLVTSHRIDDPAFIDTGFVWTQARAAYIPGDDFAVMTMSPRYSKGSDVYLDLYEAYSEDRGKTWTDPVIIPELKLHEIGGGYWRSMSDMTPQWHRKSGKVLNIGKSFFYTDKSHPDRSRREVAYAVLDPGTKKWSNYLKLDLPMYDHDSLLMSAPVAGCVQWLEMENGDVLIPISYRKLTPAQAATTTREAYNVANNMKNNDLGGSITVLRCSFDGEKLTYLSHGTELQKKAGRGLGEPSLAFFGGEYFLTMRQDKTAYVSKSADGLHFGEPKEWRFDDDSLLGNYNTQQHWVTHKDALFLVYTRRGAGNDHVFRHRAPLFMAQVDTESLRVIRETERIIVPEEGIALGNFGVTHVNENETWVVTTEYHRGEKAYMDNEVYVARILWQQ